MYFNTNQKRAIKETIAKGGYAKLVCSQGSYTNSGVGDEWIVFSETININNISDLSYITHLTSVNYLYECLEVVKNNAKGYFKKPNRYIETNLIIKLFNRYDEQIQITEYDFDDLVDVDYYYY
jgi:hypothetical protein